ncbi:MAG: glycosyltransferase family 2 protein [Candidatus Magasanikbacteria bacterium]|nr:glycosyltransferase family 2 protein [Candidatus Magasanikbacteria bacterium]
MEMLPKVAIIYLSYHSEPYLRRAMEAWQNITYPKDQVEFIIVDNTHPEFGSSAEFIKQTIGEGNNLLRVTLLAQTANLGFAGGNNVGIKKALALGCKYIYLHNQDGFLEPACLPKLVEAMESDPLIGAAQSLVLLYPETDLINTAGNQRHFLGFGYSGGLRQPVSFRPTPHRRAGGEKWRNPLIYEEVPYASGASLLLRADLLQQHGLLDEDFFAYHEDLEYSLRLKSLGYKTVVVPDAKFFHEYNFRRNQDKYYLMERNRFAIILMYYQWPTILLLLPIAIPVEIGLGFIALLQGWWREKWRAYLYWLKPWSWKLWFDRRKQIQSQRKISDRQLLASATGVIQFDDQAFNNPLLKYIGNPLMRGYWGVVRRLIFW